MRATHRNDLAGAGTLLDESRALLDTVRAALADHPQTRWAGFVHDAEKEYAEGAITLSLVAGDPLPTPDEAGVTPNAWLHGIAEAIGELRRRTLDQLRAGDVEAASGLFELMETLFAVLGRIDYPDAMTNGLRRAADADRGIVERTRADVTVAMVQHRLERALERETPEP